MGGLLDDLERAFSGFGWTSLFEVAAIALVLYLTLRLLRGTTAMSVVRGMVSVVLAAAVLARVANSLVLNWMIDNALEVLLIVVLVVFQPELRRALEHVGRARAVRAPIGLRQPYSELIPMVAAVSARLAHQRIGALIVFERQTGLEELADTGVRIGAAPSTDLLESIFQPGSALHDGAVLLRPGEVIAAACILPSAAGGHAERAHGQGADHPHYGTRHRAAISVSEETDAIAVVVSEETGAISLVEGGEMRQGLDRPALEQALARQLRPRRGAGGAFWTRRGDRRAAADRSGGAAPAGS